MSILYGCVLFFSCTCTRSVRKVTATAMPAGEHVRSALAIAWAGPACSLRIFTAASLWIALLTVSRRDCRIMPSFDYKLSFLHWLHRPSFHLHDHAIFHEAYVSLGGSRCFATSPEVCDYLVAILQRSRSCHQSDCTAFYPAARVVDNTETALLGLHPCPFHVGYVGHNTSYRYTKRCLQFGAQSAKLCDADWWFCWGVVSYAEG